ncbi:MAG TPA: phosphoribosylglycinamide formyltransferase, partial [Clostridiales bacterium]|nr:phosphoribosylglycinamide formyltransferase [Clostridiales bacterium]
MVNIAVLVSGGGTNLQALMDKIQNGTVTNGKIAVVIASNDKAYAIQRAKDNNIP